MTVKTLRSEEARRRWPALLDLVHAGETEVVIERHNKPAAVVINYDLWRILRQQYYLFLARQRAAELVQTPDLAIPWNTVEAGLREQGLLDA